MGDRRVIILGVLIFVLLAAWWMNHQIAIDRCLDAGGRWNYDDDSCEGAHDSGRGQGLNLHRTP